MSHQPSASPGPQPPTDPRAPGPTWIDLTGDRKSAWTVHWGLLILLLGIPLAIAAFPAYKALTGDDEETARSFVVAFTVLGIPLLTLSGLLVIAAPRYLARQGVELGARGITVVRHSKWWSGERAAFVPWADVHQIAWGLRRGRNAKRTLEVHLRQVDDAVRLPSWATLVPAGGGKWGSMSSHPRIIFDSDRKTLAQLNEELASLSPAPFQDETEPAVPAPERRSPGTDVRPPAAGTGPSHRVNMRWQGALGWAVTTVLCVYLTAGVIVMSVVVAVSGEILGTVGLLVLALILGLLCRLLLRMTPRYSTRQGMVVDGTGIALVQEPQWWFPGRKAHIPWSLVSHISQDLIVTRSENGQKVQYLIDIDLHEPLRDVELPTWAVLDEGRVRIKSSKARHEETVQALRGPRPDLFPG